ncbi:MAG: TetR/AcrR family transcriptional regulator [Bifidobacteriaceae bacterium]|jgi:AcrR family transcriptional regulator|nr:TetR/AcrR family transcriptional regulator [Bifidobacteriaceae bacterium]
MVFDQNAWEHLPLRRVPRQARSREKVAKALAAADRIVRDQGPDGLSLPQVAARAGVSVGALYQYLPDRDAIVEAMVWRYHARLEALLDKAIGAARRNPPGGDPIPFIIDSVAKIYREEESARCLRGSADTAALAVQRRAHKERMAAKLAALLEAVGVPTDDQSGRPVAQVAFAAADAVLHEAFARPEPVRSALLAELGLLMGRYLRPPSAAASA